MIRHIGVRLLLFVVLATASVVPALILASRMDEPAMQREFEAVRERHLLVARNLASALQRYARDVEIVFRSTAKSLLHGIGDTHVRELLEGLNFHHVCIVEPDGKVVASVAPKPGKLPERIPEHLMNLIDPLHPAGEVMFIPVLPGPDGSPRISLAMRLQEQNIAIAAIGTEYFHDLQRAVTFGIAGHAAIFDQTGKVLAHPSEEWGRQMKSLRGLEPVDRMIAGESGVAVFYSPALKTEMVAGYSTVDGAGWGAMIPQPLTELEASAREFQTIVLSIILFGAMIAALLSWWLAGYLTRPVIAVTRAAQQLANDEPVQPVVLGRGAPGELRTLVESFQTMVYRLAEANRRIRLSEARFKCFAETAADWFWETDADLHLVYLSDRFESTTGSRPENVLGQPLSSVIAAHVPVDSERRTLLDRVAARQPLVELELRWAHSDGVERVQHVNGIPVVDENNCFQGYRGTGRDVTTARRLSERLSHQAKHDDLTGLINRREFEQRLQDLMQAARTAATEHALCFLDLDRFKIVNDTCGHVAGDELLRQIGVLLLTRTRKGDIVARLGGDEFAIVLMHCSMSEAVRVATTAKDAIAELRFAWKDSVFSVGASVGVVPIGSEKSNLTTLMQEADAACYAAKYRGRNRIHVYREDDMERAQHQGEMQWIRRLANALEEDRLVLYCQQILSLGDVREHVGCEVLARLRTEDGTIVPAAEFMPVAERYDLVTQIDRRVVELAFGWLARHRKSNIALGMCSINLSGRSLSDEAFLEYLLQTAQECDIDRSHVCFEITETAAITNLSSATTFVRALKKQGFLFALDDFGSGLSSFAYLKSLPIDFVKIDGAFVRDIVLDPVDRAMVSAINDMGHVLGKRTIAEFVDNERTANMLGQIGVDFAQGTLYGDARPMSESVPRIG